MPEQDDWLKKLLAFFREPAGEHIPGADPLYDMTNSAMQRIYEQNPLSKDIPQIYLGTPYEQPEREATPWMSPVRSDEEHANMVAEVARNKEAKRAENRAQIQRAGQMLGLGEDIFPEQPDVPPYALADRAAGLVEEKRPQPGQAQQIVDAEYERKQEAQRLQSEGADQVQALKEAAKQAQLDELSSLEGMPADKLWAIRGQARAKGSHGDLGYGGQPALEDYEETRYGSGGSFSAPDMTPELQQRLDDRDAWLAGAPIRDATFQTSPEQARRNPQRAALAGEKLADLKRTRVAEQEVANRQVLVDAISKGGMIPHEMAQSMYASGMTSIPWEMVDASPQESDSFFDALLEEAGQNLMSFSPLDVAGGNPMAEWTRAARDYANQFKQMARQPGANRKQLMLAYKQKMAELAMIMGVAQQAQSAELNTAVGLNEAP